MERKNILLSVVIGISMIYLTGCGKDPVADVEHSEGVIKPPDEAYLVYCDEDCVLYKDRSNPDMDKGSYFLVMYRWQDKVLSVLAEEETAIGDLELYNGKIYYSTEIVENIKYRTVEDGKEQITEEEDSVGIRLNRMEPDGTGKETIFEYRYQEIYQGDGQPDPIYRMNIDGNKCRKIGQLPRE